MLITTDKVKELNPCDDRFNNFTTEYPSYSGTLSDFVKLDKITYGDKVWVFTTLLDKDTLVRWSIKCAESVKHIYGDEMKDNKLDTVFNTLNNIENFNNMTQRQIESARSAAWSAELVWLAARSATRSAEAAIRSAEAAARSATRSAARSAAAAAEAVARSAAAAAADEKQQEQLNLDLLVQVLDEKGL